MKIKKSIPNLVVICINDKVEGDFSGLIYDRYHENAISFYNVLKMVKILEYFFDEINFPQSSVRTRNFLKNNVDSAIHETVNQYPQYAGDEILCHRGSKATFALEVETRLNASWQGRVTWLEEDAEREFSSVMELMILLDNALKS